MPLTLAEALDLVKSKLGNDPKEKDESHISVILEDLTRSTDFGWLFQCSSAKYARTRSDLDLPTGSATFLVNKHSGEIKTYRAMSWDEIELSYSKELEAGAGTWAIGLSAGVDYKKAAIVARDIFEITSKEALQMFHSSPCMIGRGDWFAMNNLAKIFEKRGVKLEVKVLKEEFQSLPEYKVYFRSAVIDVKANRILS